MGGFLGSFKGPGRSRGPEKYKICTYKNLDDLILIKFGAKIYFEMFYLIREGKLNFGFWFGPNPLKPRFEESFIDNISYCWAKSEKLRPSRDLILSKTYREIHLNIFSKTEVTVLQIL